MKLPTQLVVLAICVLSAATLAAVSPSAFPLLLRQNGVGGIVGAVGKLDIEDGPSIFVAQTLGAVTAHGVAVTGMPVWPGFIHIDAGVGDMANARLDTSYTRGISEDHAVDQRIGATGGGLTLNGRFLENRLKAYVGWGKSTVRLKNYFDSNGNEIYFDRGPLHDIDATHRLAGISFAEVDDEKQPTRGYRISLGGLTNEGRIAQSDQLVITHSLSTFFPVATGTTLALHYWGSDAAVLKTSAYDNRAAVLGALGTDCTQAGAGAPEERCSRFKSDLADYISASNKHGTAQALGGSGRLRSYREFRFRAGHQRLAAVEVRWDAGRYFESAYFSKERKKLELVAFGETGFSSDLHADLFRRAAYSSGVGIRVHAADIPLRLEAAVGSEGFGWFFTAGQPW